MMNTRKVAYQILNKTIEDESYANLLMREELNTLPEINRPFVTEIVYGTLRNYDLLLYQINEEINDKTKLKYRNLLALALYERYFMNTKDYALVNEYVELVDNKYDKAFINAILRKTKDFKYADNTIQGQAINYSLPLWIYNLLSKQYTKEELHKILNVYKTKASTYYRLNLKKASYDDLKKLDIEIIDERIFKAKKPLFETKEFKNGCFYVQDINSAYLVDNLDLNKDDTLLDMCAAPGSKLFNALDIVNPKNTYANDLYEHRVELIKKTAKKLGFDDVNLLNYDARDLNKHLDLMFDKILLDVPCSGLGVLSRKPDLKFHINPNSLDELEVLQGQLLDTAYLLLKNKGILLYSTCTLNVKENSKQVKKFCEKYSDIKLLKEETIIKEGGDCFYFAKMIKE